MNIIVCIKQVLDPEAPPSSFKIDMESNKVLASLGVPYVINPFDEQALEAALRIKDAKGGKVIAISLGAKLQRDVVRKALSMGADELILLEDEALANGDSWSTAYALAMAIKKFGSFDLILCGRQAADTDAGQVGSGIAEFLGIPSVTIARKIEVLDGKVQVERVVSDGLEVIEASLPALVTVSNELGEPRYPTIRGIMAAKKKELTIWKAADIGVTQDKAGAAGNISKVEKLSQPVRDSKCEMVSGETPEEAAVNLALRLREAKVL